MRGPEGCCLVESASSEVGSRGGGALPTCPPCSLSTEHQLCKRIPGPLRTALQGVPAADLTEAAREQARSQALHHMDTTTVRERLSPGRGAYADF